MKATTFLVPFLAVLTACPGAQVKGNNSGEVNVVLRRIDVVEADYDKMKLNVILAVENGTGDDINVSADGSIAIVGEGKEEDDSAAEKPAAEGEGDKGSVPEEETHSSAKPVDGSRHNGSGSGKAVAFNTSELPLVVELPLPSDPAVLEEVLGWKKMLVDADITVKVGMLTTKKLGGTREVAPPHMPEVKLKEAQVASVDGGTAGTAFFTVLLDNKNPFPVTVDKLSWTITIKDKQLDPQNGTTSVEHDTVPASAVGEYSAEALVNEKAFGKDLKAILKSPAVPYVIDGAVEVRGIKKTFHFTGDMKFAR